MERRHVGLLLVGVAAMSSSAVLVRLAGDAEVPSLAIAFYRVALASAVLLPIAWLRHRAEIRALTRDRWHLALLSGTALGLHFSTWIPSIELTSVAASAVLVQTTPIWVALLARFVGERPTRRTMLGIGLAIAGVLVISGGGFGSGGRALLGNALALAGAAFGAIYLLFGRNLRRSMSVATYAAIVYSTASAVLATAMIVSGTPFAGFAPEAWALFAAMTVGPQFLGHTVFNELLGHLRATVVSIALLAEPVGATTLAWIVLDEAPTAPTLVGGGVVLIGVFIAMRAEAARVPEVLSQPPE